jgi:hypothetical protein
MNAIPIPKRLRKRPLFHGLPIPYIALIKPDGQPDFRVVDENARLAVMRLRRCQLCGEPLGKWCFFLGGTEAAKANMYYEPPTHMDCLLYAMQVCPFIVGRIEHADLEKVQKDIDKSVARYVTKHGGEEGITVHADETFSAVRNPWWVIKKASDWVVARTPQGTILLVPQPVKTTKPLHPETMTAADWQKVKEELL